MKLSSQYTNNGSTSSVQISYQSTAVIMGVSMQSLVTVILARYWPSREGSQANLNKDGADWTNADSLPTLQRGGGMPYLHVQAFTGAGVRAKSRHADTKQG